MRKWPREIDDLLWLLLWLSHVGCRCPIIHTKEQCHFVNSVAQNKHDADRGHVVSICYHINLAVLAI